jgi:hypothetical protein
MRCLAGCVIATACSPFVQPVAPVPAVPPVAPSVQADVTLVAAPAVMPAACETPAPPVAPEPEPAPKPAPAPACGPTVAFVSTHDGWVELELANPSERTIEIASSQSTSFVDAGGALMLAEMGASDDEWFMPFALPAQTHRRVRVRLDGGEPARLDRIVSGSCTIAVTR